MFNVYKHAEAKSARLELSGRRDRVMLTVSDGGKGFDPSILRSGAAKDRLGLLSIRERARYLGGDLEIESKPGEGSRLTLALPLEVAGAGESVRFAPEPERKRSGPAILKDLEVKASIRVLFVDDHKVMRQGLVKLIGGQPEIEAAGEAADGSEALEKALVLEPDVILMDVSMPGMDGIEATRRIKEKMPGVRVIGLSMHEDEKIAAEMRKAGAEVFLSKTASPAELLSAVYGSKGVKK